MQIYLFSQLNHAICTKFILVIITKYPNNTSDSSKCVRSFKAFPSNILNFATKLIAHSIYPLIFVF